MDVIPPATRTYFDPPVLWAVVELMGHVRHVGRLTEEEHFGAKLGRVDTPNADGTETTVFFGGAAVYRITPTTEEAAREMNRPRRPVSPLGLPGRRDDDEDGYEDDNDDEDGYEDDDDTPY